MQYVCRLHLTLSSNRSGGSRCRCRGACPSSANRAHKVALAGIGRQWLAPVVAIVRALGITDTAILLLEHGHGRHTPMHEVVVDIEDVQIELAE